MLATYAYSSYAVLSDELQKEAESILQVYGGTLKSRLAQTDAALQNVLLQNYDELQLLKSASETNRFYALQDIHNYISDAILNDGGIGCLVVADTAYDLCVDAQASSVSYWDRMALRQYAVECAGRGDVPKTWRFVPSTIAYTFASCMCTTAARRALLPRADTFLANVPGGGDREQTLALTGADGTIAAYAGDALSDGRSVRLCRPAGLGRPRGGCTPWRTDRCRCTCACAA